jgi:hypothetical protein
MTCSDTSPVGMQFFWCRCAPPAVKAFYKPPFYAVCRRCYCRFKNAIFRRYLLRKPAARVLIIRFSPPQAGRICFKAFARVSTEDYL